MNIDDMTHYQLNKGENLDTDGRNLYDYIHSDLDTYNNICIIDDGLATIQSMDNMFYNIYFAKNIELSNFNTSNVTNTQYMFQICRNLVTISTFNTSKVTNMQNMFRWLLGFDINT